MSGLAATTESTRAEVELHAQEVQESRRAERRLLVWEIVTLLLVVAFVVVRQRWLV